MSDKKKPENKPSDDKRQRSSQHVALKNQVKTSEFKPKTEASPPQRPTNKK